MITRINGHREEPTNSDGVVVKITGRGAIVTGYADAQREALRLGGVVIPALDPFDLDSDEWEVFASRGV
jgi:hypothetical protein